LGKKWKNFYNTEEVCKILEISRITLMRKIRAGKIKSLGEGQGSPHKFVKREIERLRDGR
jgi:predicted site-specific integrase-resolvase